MSQFRDDQLEQRLSDLQTIASQGFDKLDQLATVLEKESPAALSPANLVAVFGKVIDDEDADTLARTLVSMSGWANQIGIDAADLVASLPESIGYEADAISGWEETQGIIAKLASSPRIRLISKGIELAYEQTTLLRRTRVLTDIRPIFDEQANEIDGTIVSFSMRVDYTIADREETISMAIDKNDIERLIDQLERSLTKAQTAKLWIEQRDTPVVVSGE